MGHVTLSSSLKQGSLCPEDEGATFICTATGSDIVWVIDNQTSSFNPFSVVGEKIPRRFYIAILIYVGTRMDGRTVRKSVLNIHGRPSGMVTVKCHNGSSSTNETMNYRHEVAGTY